jgi:hypothetical protein
MAGSGLSPVAVAVFAHVQDLAVAGGVHDDIPQERTYPLVWLELPDETEDRGFGTGSLPAIELRAHTYSLAGQKREAQDVNSLVVARLRDAELQIEGYRQCGQVFYDRTVQFPDEELNGVKVHEVVSSYRIYAEAL